MKNNKRVERCKKHPWEDELPCQTCRLEEIKNNKEKKNRENVLDRAKNAPEYFDMFGISEDDYDDGE